MATNCNTLRFNNRNTLPTADVFGVFFSGVCQRPHGSLAQSRVSVVMVEKVHGNIRSCVAYGIWLVLIILVSELCSNLLHYLWFEHTG